MQMGLLRIGIGHARGKPLLAKLLAEVSALGGVLYAPPVSGDWLFQDAAGTTPAGNSDPVGLMLDAAEDDDATQSVSASRPTVGVEWDGKGALGPELVTNGTFDANTTSWTAYNGDTTLGVSSGRLQVTYESGGASGVSATQEVTTEAGKSYLFSADYFGSAGNRARINVRDTNVFGAPLVGLSQTTDSGTITQTFVALSNTTVVRLWSYDDGGTAEYDNISVREIPPASQRVYLDCDGTDDHFRTSATLTGAGAMIVALRPAVGQSGVDVFIGFGGVNDRGFLGLDDGVLAGGIGSDSFDTIKATDDLRGNWHVGAVVWDGSRVQLWQDNTIVYDEPQNNSPSTTKALYVGAAQADAGVDANHFLGDIACAAIIPSDPTDAQMQRIMNLMGQLVGTV